jgi:hypothetical protein
VTVQLRNRVTALLARHGRHLARLNPHVQRALRPGAHTSLALRYNGRLRGALTAIVRIRLGSGIRVERRYPIRL